jgi:hypothetical protein
MAADLAAPEGRQLDEVDRMAGRKLAGQVGEEDEASLEQADEQQFCRVVVGCDLGAELCYSAADLLGAEIDVPDPGAVAQRSWYRCASRSRSRL